MIDLAPALHVNGRSNAFFRRIWKGVLIGSILQPLLYLLGVGIGVGSLVDQGDQAATLLDGASYLAFYATALVATSPMFVVGQDALWPILDGFLWSNAYRAMVTTPLRPVDVVLGTAIHWCLRGVIAAGGVATVLLLFDDTRSPGLLLATGVGVLVGLAFGLPLAAWTATRDGDASFPAILRFGIIPMFLFAGVFYPVEQLPDWLEPVAWITPLFHGVELCRGAVIGGLGAGRALVHLGVLLAFVVGGFVAATITYGKRLHS